MAALRSLVAVLLTVLTLFGGAFRAQSVARAQVAVDSATSDGAEHATLDTGRAAVQARATRPSTDTRESFAPSFDSPAGVRLARIDAREATGTGRAPEEPHRRRVRTHVEHMVFLI